MTSVAGKRYDAGKSLVGPIPSLSGQVGCLLRAGRTNVHFQIRSAHNGLAPQPLSGPSQGSNLKISKKGKFRDANKVRFIKGQDYREWRHGCNKYAGTEACINRAVLEVT